jgi:hypothetical protein
VLEFVNNWSYKYNVECFSLFGQWTVRNELVCCSLLRVLAGFRLEDLRNSWVSSLCFRKQMSGILKPIHTIKMM